MTNVAELGRVTAELDAAVHNAYQLLERSERDHRHLQAAS